MQAQAQTLVGRTSEVEVLDRLLDGVRAGAPVSYTHLTLPTN